MTRIPNASGVLYPNIRNTGLSILESTNTHSLLANRYLCLRDPVVMGAQFISVSCHIGRAEVVPGLSVR